MIRGITNNYDVNFMYSKPTYTTPNKKSDHSALQSPRQTTKNKDQSKKIATTALAVASVIAAAGTELYYLKSTRSKPKEVILPILHM